MARRRATAPALSRGSLRLPHLGDCTHDGQPVVARAGRDHLERGLEVAPAGGEAELGDAGAAGVAVVDHDRRPARCRPGAAVDTPPTSQRSQMVNSGSMPMAACSAACSVPGHAAGVDAGRRAARRGRPRTRTPAWSRQVGGQVEVVGRRAPRRWTGPCAGSRSTCSRDLDRAEVRASTRPTARGCAPRSRMRMSVSERAWVSSSPSAGDDPGDVVVEVEVARPASAWPWWR